jgi:hypothetical protein
MYGSREQRSIVITLNACDFKRTVPRLSFSEPLSLSTTVCATVALRSATV